MKKQLPQAQVYWYLNALSEKPLTSHIKTDVVVIGGGMAGLTAAQACINKGLSVVVLEQQFCGSGATGKSSGFITPTAELGLPYFEKVYGAQQATHIWSFVTCGVEHIRSNIQTYDLQCDYQPQDTVVVASSTIGYRELAHEHQVRQRLGFDAHLYDATTAKSLVQSDGYYGVLRYGNTFGIKAFAYAQEMKKVLIQDGVSVYEESPALAIDQHTVTTAHGSVQAEHIIVCVDKFLPELHKLKKDVYHVQTFLMASEPLSDKDAQALFPNDACMVWDTDLIYQYYRLTGENRLLLGGGTYWSSYLAHENFNAWGAHNKLTKYFAKKFPQVKVEFSYMWPGMIGISKDIVPIAQRDAQNPHIYYVSAATGLPWAAALGNYSVQHLFENRTDLDSYFTTSRFGISDVVQTVFGKKITFGVSNLMSMIKSNT